MSVMSLLVFPIPVPIILLSGVGISLCVIRRVSTMKVTLGFVGIEQCSSGFGDAPLVIHIQQ
jgi:hypothetical protein